MEKIAEGLSPGVVERCRQGDQSSFKELYDLYKNRIYTTSYRMLGNAQDAEEAAQDTFIKIFRSIKNFEGKSSIFTWMYRIAANTCIEYLRKRKSAPQQDSIDDPEGYIPDIPYDDRSVTTRMIIEHEIELLPEGFKTVFVLHTIEGFKHREIAEILDISEGTSKSQLSAAKAKLRKQLLPYMEVLKNEM